MPSTPVGRYALTAAFAAGLLTLGFLGLHREREAPPACADSIGCVVIGPEEPVRIGVLHDVSGSAAAIGIEQRRIIGMALAERGNRLLGRPIHIEEEDARCSPEGGRVAAAKLSADPRIVALLGTTCSGSAAFAIPVISAAGFAMVSGVNSAPSLTGALGQLESDWRPGYFRTRYNGALQGQMAARFAHRQLGILRAATVDDGDTYTRGVAEAFRRAFIDLGGEITMGATINKEDREMAPILSGIRDSGAQLVFFPLFRPQAIRLVRQARKMADFSDVVLMGGSALVSDPFVSAMGEDGRGIYFCNAVLPENPAVGRLVERYQERYGRVELMSGFASGHDAVTLLFSAIAGVAVLLPDGSIRIGRQALRDALASTKGLSGLSGIIACDAFGDCGVQVFSMVRLEDPAAGAAGLRANVLHRFMPEGEGADG